MSRRPATLVRQAGGASVAAGVAVASGLLLDVIIAVTFGAGPDTDAFFIAARLPLSVTLVLMAGANQSLVPLFSTWLVRLGERNTWAGVTRLILWAVVFAASLSALLALAAPLVVSALAPGSDAVVQARAASLLRLLSVMLPLTALAEILRAVLNARYSFAGPAAMNAVMNGVAAGIVVLGPQDIRVVAWAYIAGAVLRLGYLFVLANRVGFAVVGEGGQEQARAAVRKSGPPVLAAGLSPIGRIAEQIVASFLPAGSITILNYAHRLVWSISGTVFFRSVIVTLVPRMSEAHAADAHEQVQAILRRGVRMMLLVSLPLTIGMSLLARPAVLLVFGRGDFSDSDAVLLGGVLAILSLALVPEALNRVLLLPFFAALDVMTPLRNAAYALGLNMALLFGVMALQSGGSAALFGVAAAFTLSRLIIPVHAWRQLISLDHPLHAGVLDGLRTLWMPTVAAALVMGGGVLVADLWAPLSSVQLLLRGTIVGVAGLAVFAALTVRTSPRTIAMLRGRGTASGRGDKSRSDAG